jgi:hypothetical protein
MTETAETPTLEVTPQFASYLDVQDDVRPWLQLSDTPEPVIDRKLQITTSAICLRVQNYLGKPLGETEFFQRFSGWPGNNGAILMLPYYPVTKIVRVVEYRGSSGPYVLVEQTPEENQGSSETFQIKPLTGMLIRTFMGNLQRPWFPGSNNIEVTWRAGYNPVPDDIYMATLEYIKRWWDSTQQSSRSPQPAGALGYSGPVTPTMAGAWGDLERTISLYEQTGMG